MVDRVGEESPYIIVKLNRRRCEPKLERLKRHTKRSAANLLEFLLDRATERELVAMPDDEDLRRPEAPHA